MKKHILTFAIVLCLAALLVTASAATPRTDLTVLVDGEPIEAAVIEDNGSILVALRPVAVAMGIPDDAEHIIWSQADKSVRLVAGETSWTIVTGSNQLGVIKGDEADIIPMTSAPALLVEGKTYVPLEMVKTCFDGSAAAVTSESVLLRTPVSVEPVRELLGKQAEVDKMTMDMAMEVTMSDGVTEMELNGTVVAKADMANSLIEMDMKMSVPGILDEMAMQMFMDGEKLYMVMDGEVEVTDAPFDMSELMAQAAAVPVEGIENMLICVMYAQEGNKLKGDLAPVIEDAMNYAYAMTGMSAEELGMEMTVDSFLVEYAFDDAGNCTGADMKFDMSVGAVGQTTKVVGAVVVTIDYDTEVTIVLPKVG